MEQHSQWKKDKQARHARWKSENLSYLKECGISFTLYDGDNIVVIGNGQFTPSTGRYFDRRFPRNVMRGGAKCFVGWLRKNGVL